MPWTLDAPPPPAKHWTTDQKRRCVAAANATLERERNKGNKNAEQEAIYACIHAAGKSKYKQEDDYDQAGEDASLAMQDLVQRYKDGKLSKDELKKLLREAVELNLLRMVLLGRKDQPLSEADLKWINAQVEIQYDYLDGYINDVDEMSLDKSLWRIALYGYPRHAYVFGSVDSAIGLIMPVLPGEDCLGMGNCKCSLEVEEDDENYYVYWILDPVAEHCGVCMTHAVEFAPLSFPKRE